ncbi:MAG: retropepsin-like aspartic protease [Candidatus Thermoplasmatota archaeon]|nr:retropepsin-like aspartic protease [Candidatus Thermoplasmatota archaeon]
MRIDPEAPAILVSAKLIGPSGECALEMAFDTGATYIMVPWYVAEKLGYDPAVSRERVPLMTASTMEVAPLINVESVKVLGLEVNNAKVAVHDLPPKSRVDGLLGLSFLKHFDTDIHFKKNILKIKDP